jgi:hypothetical protein
MFALERMGGMPAEELAEQLRLLITRAGNPSVRELAKLTERQGPVAAMSRSTLQDKISGKNPPRLGQVLAIVRACADYAESIAAPLTPLDADEQVWRERVEDASARSSPPPPAVTVDVTAIQSTRWDLDPLRRAGMRDMVDLVLVSEGQPMATWFHPLIEALDIAGMSSEQFLKAASTEQPADLVESLITLASYGHEEALYRLMVLCARNQPPESIPVIMVLLRRKKTDEGNKLAERLMGVLTGDDNPPGHGRLRDDITSVVLALRGATLNQDASRLIKGIGRDGQPDVVFEAVVSLPGSVRRSRESVLSSVGTGRWQILRVLKQLRKTTIEGIDRNDVLDQIIVGIPFHDFDETVSFLKEQGLPEEAARCLELKDDIPPF